MIYVKAAVEGKLDDAIVRRLVANAGAEIVNVYRADGRANLISRIRGYAAAARYDRWLVLCDLDRDECAPKFVASAVQNPPALFCFRVAVRSVESWLLADPGLAAHMEISLALLPHEPDSEPHPKQTLIRLAQRSRNRDIRLGVGGDRGTSDAPSLYNSFLSDFVESDWDPAQAAGRSDSLRRAMEAVSRLAGG